MRRCVSCILLVCMVFLFSALPAHADDMTEYELKDLGMTISLPSDCTVITRENLDDLSFVDADMTKEDLLEILEEGNLYLETSEPGLSTGWNITVTTAENTMGFDLNKAGDSTSALLPDSIPSDMEKKGIRELDSYSTPEATFIRFSMLKPDSLLEWHSVFYVTTHDDLLIYINMVPTLGDLDEEDEALLKTVVDSIRFDSEHHPDEAESQSETDRLAAEAASYIYTDEITNTSFSVPEGWAEAPFNTQPEILKVKFVPQDSGGMHMIMYGWADARGALSDEEIEMVNGNEALLNGFIKTALYDYGLAESDIDSVVYGDNEYIVGTKSLDMLGLTVGEVYTAIYKNGYLYLFQFQSTEDNMEAYRQDFESLLASVQFSE